MYAALKFNFVGPIISVGVAMPNDLISELLKKYMGKYMACTVLFEKYKYAFCTVLYFCQKDVYCTFFKKYVYLVHVLTAALKSFHTSYLFFCDRFVANGIITNEP